MKKQLAIMIVVLLGLSSILTDSEASMIKPFITAKIESVTDKLIKVTIPNIEDKYKGCVYEVTPSNVSQLLNEADLYGGDFILVYDKRYVREHQLVRFLSLAEFTDWLVPQNWKDPNVAGAVGGWCFLDYALKNELIDGYKMKLNIVNWDMKFERGAHYYWAHDTKNKEKDYWPGHFYWGVAFKIVGHPKIITEIYSDAAQKTKFKLQKKY